MLRYLTKKLKRERKERNHDVVKPIYMRGASSVPAESLICHKDADEETRRRVLAAAQARRDRRNGKQAEEEE